jgi:hypothetical protein
LGRNTVPSTATLQAICAGLKITLSQFFAEGEMIELTPVLASGVHDHKVSGKTSQLLSEYNEPKKSK